jgi:hypothetical protein
LVGGIVTLMKADKKARYSKKTASVWLTLALVGGLVLCFGYGGLMSYRAAKRTVYTAFVWRALERYVEDHQGNLPSASQWTDELLPYLQKDYLRKDLDNRQLRFGYNVAVAGRKLTEVPDQTALLFELQTPGWNVSGGSNLVRRAWDGQVSFVVRNNGELSPRTYTDARRPNALNWQP